MSFKKTFIVFKSDTRIAILLILKKKTPRTSHYCLGLSSPRESFFTHLEDKLFFATGMYHINHALGHLKGSADIPLLFTSKALKLNNQFLKIF